MNCSNCGQVVADESLGFCMECGEAFNASAGQGADEDNPDAYAEGYSDSEWREPRPSVWDTLSRVLAPVRSVAGQLGDVFVNILESPSLYGQMPGGSLTFLGLGLVGLALLFSVVPFIEGIGGLGSWVMFGWGVLVLLSEWREVSEAPPREGRFVEAYPAVIEKLPREVWHPGVIQAYALVTCAYALRMVGYGPISLLWLLAAGVLGYEQGRRFFYLLPQDEAALASSAEHPGLHRWVVPGVVVGALSLLLPWGRMSGLSTSVYGVDLPLSVLTLSCLLLLGCYAVKHQGLGGLHPMVLILVAVWLALWLVLMNNVYSPGSWVYLVGVLLLDTAIVRHLIPVRSRPEEAPQEEPPPDLDYQG